MAEVAAGALVAEQVVSTAVEATAVVAIARPTQPLEASLSQIATSPSDDSSLALARSHHTVTVIDGKAYIFGGQRADGQLCTTDVHAVTLPDEKTQTGSDYACYPALAMTDAETGETLVPSPRTKHAACARGKYIIVHGGCDLDGNPVDEQCIWLWDSTTLSWSRVRAPSQIGKSLSPRFDHRIFVDESEDILVLHGGRTASGGSITNETWLYTFDTLAWTELPSSPAAPTAAAFVDNVLYTVSSDANMAGAVNILDLKRNPVDRENSDALQWHTTPFPATPLTPGPAPREGGALVPITTGAGRNYLIYMFGNKTEGTGEEDLYSDVWALQLPTHGVSGASIKDAIRNALPRMESGELSWAEVQLLPVEEIKAEGKAHPGPRGYFGADGSGGKGVVVWGGVSAKGAEGDGWLLKVR